MATYRAGKSEKGKRRRVIVWLCILCLLVGLGVWGWTWVRQQLQPKTTIKQAAAVVTKVNYNSATKEYDEPDFKISVPSAWRPVPRPPGPYQSYTWQTSDSGTDGEEIMVFEDTIPVNFAVNRALIVLGEVDHLALDGSASDNCSNYTRGTTATVPYGVGVLAKWQGISFLCDQKNQERDVIGTSSTDGINTVILKKSTGTSHKFFFTYTNHSTNPDYTVFYNVIQSFHMN